MRDFKRSYRHIILVLVSAGLLMALLVACGSGDSTEEPTSSESSATESESRSESERVQGRQDSTRVPTSAASTPASTARSERQPTVALAMTPAPAGALATTPPLRPTAAATPAPTAAATPAPTAAATPAPTTPAPTPLPANTELISEDWTLTDGTPIHRAAINGSTQDVQDLLDQGADPYSPALINRIANANAELGMNDVLPLHLAAGFNPDPMVIALLLEHMRGTSVDDRVDPEGPWFAGHWRPLHFAASQNDEPKVVEILLEWGADINADSGDRLWTPINYAVRVNPNPAVAELLLDWGANANTQEGYYYELVSFAARFNSNPDMVAMLIDRSGGLPSSFRGLPRSFRGGTTPVHDAVLNPNPKVLEILLDRGLDVNALGRYGDNPLNISARGSQSPEVITLLLERGADVSAKGPQGESVLHQAGTNPNPEIAELILAQGLDIEVKDDEGMTPLSWAVRSFPRYEYTGQNTLPTIEFLLDQGASANSKDNSGNTPFILAFDPSGTTSRRYMTPDYALVRLLVDRGADIDTSNIAGETPLFQAVNKERLIHTAELLAELGADLDKLDSGGNTALHLAVLRDWEQMVEMLLDNGADRKITNAAGKTVCQVARDERSFTGTPLIGQLCRP